MLEDCVLERFYNPFLFSTFLSSNGAPKLFCTVHRKVLFLVTKLFVVEVKHLQNNGALACDCNVRENNKWRPAFGENGIQGVLKAKDYVQLDNALSPLGELIDRYCSELSKAPETAVITNYVILVQ